VSSAPIGGRLDGLTSAGADWSGLRVLVAGIGLSGFAAADALLERGARVIAVDGGDPELSTPLRERANILDILGVDVRLGDEHVAGLPLETPLDLVVTSPGWRPDQPLLAQAAQAGIPVWGEVELAWRMRPEVGAAPWLTVTGTNGKTTTVNMLASMLRAAGLRATSAGNVGTPILEAVLHPEPYDVIAVELSSFQLHWSDSLAPHASACLNVAPDHVDWHGSLEEYTRAKGKVFENTKVACVSSTARCRCRRAASRAPSLASTAPIVAAAAAAGTRVPNWSAMRPISSAAVRAVAPSDRASAISTCASSSGSR
jgi:UDP-N-acetylmuramoylalanine--D-glutamate ligase